MRIRRKNFRDVQSLMAAVEADGAAGRVQSPTCLARALQCSRSALSMRCLRGWYMVYKAPGVTLIDPGEFKRSDLRFRGK
jgi:hypothetical protein